MDHIPHSPRFRDLGDLDSVLLLAELPIYSVSKAQSQRWQGACPDVEVTVS